MEAEPSHPSIEQSPAMPLSTAADAFTPDAMDTAEAPVGDHRPLGELPRL